MKLVLIEKIFLFLTLLFLPTQLGKHFFLKFSYIYSLPIDYLAPTLYFWDLLVLFLVFIWLIQKPKINKQALFLGLIFIFSQLLSLIKAVNVGSGLFRLEQLSLSLAFGIYLASKDWKQLEDFIKFPLIAALIFESLLSILQFLTNRSSIFWIFGERSFSVTTPSIAKFDFFNQVFLRPYGTFPHPNLLAAFLVLLVPLLIFPLKNNFKFILFGLSFLVAFLSFSRVAVLVLILETFIFLRSRLKFLIIPALIITPFLIIRFGAAFSFDYLSILRREELISIAWSDFLSSPFLGIGLNNFINQTAVSNLISGPNRFLQPVHNIFLLELSETGLVGFLGFLMLILLPMKKLMRNKTNYYGKILLFIWGTISFLGLFDHYFLTLAQGQRLLFLIWGLSMLELKSGNLKKSL
ncbi:O-antigen ligase family protein [Candidatus Daviesbacteria bacterium]|nr:O-antigen ligase family protein [Candidatus Daviesbacteria bacterium]